MSGYVVLKEEIRGFNDVSLYRATASSIVRMAIVIPAELGEKIQPCAVQIKGKTEIIQIRHLVTAIYEVGSSTCYMSWIIAKNL